MRSLILIMMLVFSAGQLIADEPEWGHYESVLKHIRPGVKNGVALTLVDYQNLNRNGSLEKAYLDISNFQLDKINNRNEKLSFYINAYNIFALKMIADHWPTASIKDLGRWYSPVWSKTAGMIDGKAVSLGYIEHKVLRLMGEPRIHFAIVCASVSCPDLRNEPYTAKKIDQQLDDQAQQFLNNQGKGLLIDDDSIRISKIFDWFEEDFNQVGGVATFIKAYRPGLLGLKVKTDISYDWAVNAVE